MLRVNSKKAEKEQQDYFVIFPRKKKNEEALYSDI